MAKQSGPPARAGRLEGAGRAKGWGARADGFLFLRIGRGRFFALSQIKGADLSPPLWERRARIPSDS